MSAATLIDAPHLRQFAQASTVYVSTYCAESFRYRAPSAGLESENIRNDGRF
jgi:hypothetical protein